MASILTKLFGEDNNDASITIHLDLSAKNQRNETVHLKEISNSHDYLLVYFYPKADTPGCTAQACSLRDSYAELKEKNVKIFGVSSDNVGQLVAFSEKYQLPFDLLSDQNGEIAKAFSVSSLFGFYSRQAFLFEGQKLIWRDTSASTRKQADDVLKILNNK